MSSLLNTSSTKVVAPQDFMANFESDIQAMNDVEEVELLYKKIKFLGLHFDPFSAQVSTECQQILNQFGLYQYLDNPYQMTNILLRLLDKVEERINNLKH